MNEDCVSGALCQAREQEQAPVGSPLHYMWTAKVFVPNLELTLGLNSGLLI